MSAFIRSKQSGVQNDLSASILPGMFAIDDEARYGLNSQISTLAYDPCQSILAVGTNESQYGSGQIYIFGRDRVSCVFPLSRRASVKDLQFVADKLISLDSKNELTVWDLIGKKKIVSYTAPGIVTKLVTDPMLDWAIMGLQSGEVIAFDIDRERLGPLRLPNFWKERSPRARIMSVVSMQIHPRDIGQLLIGYTEGIVLYSFKELKPVKWFQYEVPPGAPGGNSDPNGIGTVRKPRLTQCLWHPTGTFFAATYEDGSLVFWDPKDGRVVMARTLEDLAIDQPGAAGGNRPGSKGGMSVKEPYHKVAWCSKQNPDDTGLLIAGGQPMAEPTKGLTFIDLGQTPVYATSSWQFLSQHFHGKRTHILATPPGADIVDFCLIPRSSPHFAGASDPIAVIALLSSGELITLSFPSGHPISPTNMLHPSLSFVHPFVTSAQVTMVNTTRWFGMTEKRNQGPPILIGGAPLSKVVRRSYDRTILQTAHGDGTIRLFDASTTDKLENSRVLQVDVARALGCYENIAITEMSLAGQTGEMAVGTRSGEAIIFRWGVNKNVGHDPPPPSPKQCQPGEIVNIQDRTDPTLKEGLQPFVMFNAARGPITALQMSDVGFVAVGSEGGEFSIIDLRGPAIIFSGNVAEFAKQEKKGLFGKSHKRGQSIAGGDWPTKIAFGVMTLEDDQYSSICCFVGTNMGKVATFKILPLQNGTYAAQLAGVIQCNDRVMAICPMRTESGEPAVADGPTVAGLREGRAVNGTLVVVTEQECRIFTPPSSRGATKTWDDSALMCHSACITNFELHGHALVAVFGDGSTRAFALPSLRTLGVADLGFLDRSRLSASLVTPTGDIFAWASPSELAMLQVWGTGKVGDRREDVLYNTEVMVPPRPTISNVQWLTGTNYVSPTDFDVLIGGADRPPSKRMLAAAAAEKQLQAQQNRPQPNRQASGASSSAAGGSQEGWGDYMTRQIQERTEKLGLMGDSVEDTAGNSKGWSDQASDMVRKQKRGLLMKAVTKGFF